MLFNKLYKEGKNLVKQGAYDVAERKAKMRIESSINETESKMYDVIEKQKEMLGNIETFDHIEFGKLDKELITHKQSIDVLSDMYKKLFGKDYNLTQVGTVWEYFK